MLSPESYLSVASILSGFCVSVFVSRIQREVVIMDEAEKSINSKFQSTHRRRYGCLINRKPKNWLAWSDYLIIVAIMLSLLLVVLPHMVSSNVTNNPALLSLAAASCAAASILLSAYPFAILDHYRILWGKERKEERMSGEPLERFIVIAALVIAAAVWGVVFSCNIHSR